MKNKVSKLENGSQQGGLSRLPRVESLKAIHIEPGQVRSICTTVDVPAGIESIVLPGVTWRKKKQ